MPHHDLGQLHDQQAHVSAASAAGSQEEDADEVSLSPASLALARANLVEKAVSILQATRSAPSSPLARELETAGGAATSSSTSGRLRK